MYITYVSVCVHMYKKETGYKMIWYEYSICKCCPVLEGRLEPRIWRAENLGNCGTGGGTLRFVARVIEGTCKGNPGLCFTTITVSGPPLMFGGSLIDWFNSGSHWFADSLIPCFIDSNVDWFSHLLVHRSVSCAWIIFICISTNICSCISAPHNFDTGLLQHLKHFPIGHLFPIVVIFVRNFRPSAGRALSLWQVRST